MDELSKYLAEKITPEEYKNKTEDIEVVAYGIEGILCNISTLTIAIILSLLFHTTKQLLTFCLFFIPLRVSYKSFHCQTFLKCLIVSNITVCLACLILKKMTYFNGMFLSCMFLAFLDYILSIEKNKILLIILIFVSVILFSFSQNLFPSFFIALSINTVLMIIKRGANRYATT